MAAAGVFFTLVETRRDFANPQKQTAFTAFSEGKEKWHDGDSNLHGLEKGLRRAHRPDWYLEPNGYGERLRVYNGSYLTTNTSALSGAHRKRFESIYP